MYRRDRRCRKQRYCSEPDCQRQSKIASQLRWLAQPGSRNYHCGEGAVDRVRRWRQAKADNLKAPVCVLQDVISTQPVALQDIKHELTPEVPLLQDLKLAQDPLFVGFISYLIGPLQDSMASHIARFQAQGQAILGKGPGFVP
jgi:hypothetical protein